MTEIVKTIPAELADPKLYEGVAQDGVASLQAGFAPHFNAFHGLQDEAASIVDGQPKAAREMRLKLKAIRVDAEKTRKSLKEDSLRRGKAIDGLAALLEYQLVPVEKAMEEIEKAEERREAARIAALAESRTEELRPFADPTHYQLGQMSAEAWGQLLAGAKAAKAERDRLAAEAEAARIAAEKAAEEARVKAEQERQAELARLRAEREKAEAEAEAARQQAAKERAEAEERERIAKAERDRIQAEAEARDRAAKAEQDRIAREAAEREAQIRREAEAKAAAERKAAADRQAALEAEAAKERARLAEEARKAKAEADRLAEIERARQAEIAAQEAAAAKAAHDAAMAPEREKVQAFAAMLRGIQAPAMTSEAGQALAARIVAHLTKFAAQCEAEAEKL